MKIEPLSCKEIAWALDIAPTKATQATRHLWRKVALLLSCFPAKTWAHIQRELEIIEGQQADQEAEMRAQMADGRMDRSRIFPNSAVLPAARAAVPPHL